MIERQCTEAQFICTTFRPELAQNADKCYCVRYSNKVSSIVVVGKEEALQVIAEDLQEAGAAPQE